MFCPKCGTKLPEGSGFCSNCGANLKEFENNNTSNTNLNTSNQGAPVDDIKSITFKDVSDKIKPILIKYKKPIIIVTSCIVILLVFVIAYSSLYGFETLKWNQDYEDYNLTYVTQNNILLGIDFSDEDKLDKLKVKTTCGNGELSDSELNWDLTSALGECRVDISYKLQKISKTYTVISKDIDSKSHSLSLEYNIDEDSDEDLDYDSLTNKEEKSYGTNLELSDTDMDGLDDYYEINTSKTDPLKADTDSDGLNDSNEIGLGLDPLKEDSLGDGVKDGDRKLTYNINNEDLGITLEITGTGNIVDTTINTFKNSTFSNMDGLLDTVYNFYTEGKLDSAKVTIPYNIEDINNKKLNEDNLTLYYFNEDSKKLEAIPTTVDKVNKVITVTLSHFSKYVLGDSNVVLTTTNNQIMMVIDNSVSMYTSKQLSDLGFTSTGADGNDSNFKRISLTNNLIDMFTGSYYFGISEFGGDYVNLQEFTDNHDDAKKAVDSIKNDFERVDDGTNITNALEEGIDEFTKDDNGHYLILLTDGKDTSDYYPLSSNKKDIIDKANKKDVKVCVIGLGSNLDTDDLNEIAEGTGCDYYNASDASALDEIYSLVGADINYNLVDTNADGKVDGTVIADSGFIVTKNGFSFSNFVSNLSDGGQCYGMATIAELYYTKKLPMSASGKDVERTITGRSGFTRKQHSYDYNLNNTYFSSFANLYDYKLQTNVLKNTFGFETFNEDIPKNYRTVVDDTLKYSDKYRKEMEDSGIYDFTTYKSTLDKKEQIKRWGVNYDNAEDALLNEDKMQDSSLIQNSEKQILNAIYTGFIKQDVTESLASSLNFSLWIRQRHNSEDTDVTKPKTFLYLLKTRIEAGDVPVLSAKFDGDGLHAINAISLVQDNSDANHYYIGVYDNNYPGEKRYVDMICNKMNCVTKANNYYSKSNEPIRITLSLQDDIKYFEES